MKPLRFGLLGTGYFGRNYVRVLAGMPGVELSAVMSKSGESSAGLALPGSVARTTDASLIFGNPDIDCVVIATPASTHFELAREALESGKHVLLEKPMVTSLDEARKLNAVVRKCGLTFMVGHQFVYNDHLRYLRSFLESGELGEVRHTIGEHILFLQRPDIGCFWDAAPHQLSMLRFLFNPGKIKRVTGVSLPGSGLETFASATVRFESGLLSTVVVSCFGSRARSLFVAGDGGSAVFDDDVPDKLAIFRKGKVSVPVVSAREPLLNEVGHFVSCIATGKEPLTGISSSFQVTEWLDRISGSLGRDS
ncbi:Gfo/Idh/MocA family oxidoreductase [Candidatus Woesearchaeota archaeon]|nr:Gfo/Idh/MocA family oxidoreductase [Candidatus Woesearchaeota archaeon]